MTSLPAGSAPFGSARAPGKHAVTFVAITVLIDTIGLGLVMPIMPTLLMELTGENVSRAAVYGGWLAFVYAAMQFLFAPVLGNLSDRYGRRPILLRSVGALGIDYIILGFAPTLGWLFVGRMIAGIAGASFTPAYAYVADITPPERRAQSFGMVAAAFGVGFILGPAIGGLLGGLGLRAPFFAAAGLSLANLVYGYFVLAESLPPDKRRPFTLRRANPLGTLFQMRKQPMVLGLLAALFLWMIAHQVMPATWAYYTKFRFGWSEGLIGASLAMAGAVMVVSQMTILRFAVPKLGARRAALTAIAIAAVGYVGYATATVGWMMFAWLLTWFFGAIVMPTTNGLMSQRVAPDAQGELQGAVASLYSLSSIVGPPLMTYLFSHYTAESAPVHLPGAAFFASAALVVISFGVYWSVTREPSPGPVESVVASS
ncbi:MAG TPA: TCR/Tet family MFS transporter [Gemmatimonadaceae bacterium]|nr:TCR/Tet family MFS transporter [Gemmatimonadaceae bacterium]